MSSVYMWILLAGLCAIVTIGIWHKDWKPEGFQVPVTWRKPNEPHLEWVQTDLDRTARKGNSCRVIERISDDLSGAYIEVVDDTCESGLPHTIGTDRIRMPLGTWNSPEGKRNHTLQHERIHLLQQREPALWEGFYKTEWEYTVHATPPPEIVGEPLRANPDTWPRPWACWRDRYWFVPVYRDLANPRLQDTHTRIWDSVRRIWLDEAPYEWRVQFCTEGGKCPYQSEHPAEISAEYASDTAWTTPAAIALRRFLEN